MLKKKSLSILRLIMIMKKGVIAPSELQRLLVVYICTLFIFGWRISLKIRRRKSIDLVILIVQRYFH